MIHNQKKTKSVEIYPEMKEMMEQANKVLKQTSYMYKNI